MHLQKFLKAFCYQNVNAKSTLLQNTIIEIIPKYYQDS